MSRPFRLASNNANSLGTGTRFEEKFRSYRALKCDLICIQDVRAPADRVDEYRAGLQARFPGAVVGRHCAILPLSPQVTVLDSAIVELPDPDGDFLAEHGRVVHARVRYADCVTFNVVCAYAPPDAARRARFFDTLALVPDGENQIFCADFNTYPDHRLDSTCGHGHVNSWQPVATEMVSRGLVDVFRYKNPTDTWYTHRSASCNSTHSRIDFIFASRHLANHAEMVPRRHVRPAPLSDHYLQIAHFAPPELIKRGPGNWRLREHVVRDEVFITRARELSATVLERMCRPSADPLVVWDEFKGEVARLARDHEAEMRRLRSARLDALADSLEALLGADDADRTDEWIVALGHAHEDYVVALESATRAEQLSARNRALVEGDIPGRQFYARLRPPPGVAAIHTVVREDGTTAARPADVREAHRAFYADLYRYEPTANAAADDLLSGLRTSLSAEARGKLDEAFTEADVYEALRKSPKWKAPGMDGLGAGFYAALAEELAPALAFLFNHVQRVGMTPASFNSALVTLIFKKGDRRRLGNWRPISLLGTDVKLLTAIMAARVNEELADLVGPAQAGFVPGRSIFDHIFSLDAALEACERTGTPAVFAFLDQAKAYDRVAWQWLRRVLEHLGFGAAWMRVFGALYAQNIGFVMVNGFRTHAFDIERGLRQGCPLSPALYALAFEPFLQRLRDTLPVTVTRRDSVPLPTVQAYADDTLIIVQSPAAFLAMMREYQLYSLASNALLNVDKTEFIYTAAFAASGVRLTGTAPPTHASVRYLGVMFNSSGIDAEASWAKVRSGVAHRIALLKDKVLTARGRVHALNALVLSKLWFVSHVAPMSAATVKFVEGVSRAFLIRSTGGIALDKVCMHPRLGGLGLLPVRPQADACALLWWQRLLLQPHGIWQNVAWWTASQAIAKPTLNLPWLAYTAEQTGTTTDLDARWTARVRVFRTFVTVRPQFTLMSNAAVLAMPPWLAVLRRDGRQPPPDETWMALTGIGDLVSVEDGGRVHILGPSPEHAAPVNAALARVWRMVRNGAWYLNPHVMSRLADVPPDTVYSDREYLADALPAGKTWLALTVKGARLWRLNDPQPLPSRIIETTPARVWSAVFSKALPAKFQVCLWRAHHNMHFTRLRRYHMGVETSAACTECLAPVEDADHMFRTCSWTARPFWHLAHQALDVATPTNNATAFWTGGGIPARGSGLSADARRLAWAAGVFALYRARTEATFDHVPTLTHRVALAWTTELLGALTQKLKIARRAPAALREEAVAKHIRTYGVLYTRLRAFATTT